MQETGWELYLNNEDTLGFHKVDSLNLSWYQIYNKKTEEWIVHPGVSNRYYK